MLTSQHLSPHYITSLHPLICTLNLNWENWREAQRPTLLKMCLLSASPSSTSLNPPRPPSPMFRPCRKMLKLCGETQDRLAQELILFEFTIERDVIEPLYDLAEVNTPGCKSPNFIQLMPRSSCAAPSFAAATFIHDICSSNREFVTFKPFLVWLMHYSHVLCTNSPNRKTITLRALTLKQQWLCSLSCFAPPH